MEEGGEQRTACGREMARQGLSLKAVGGGREAQGTAEAVCVQARSITQEEPVAAHLCVLTLQLCLPLP